MIYDIIKRKCMLVVATIILTLVLSGVGVKNSSAQNRNMSRNFGPGPSFDRRMETDFFLDDQSDTGSQSEIFSNDQIEEDVSPAYIVADAGEEVSGKEEWHKAQEGLNNLVLTSRISGQGDGVRVQGASAETLVRVWQSGRLVLETRGSDSVRILSAEDVLAGEGKNDDGVTRELILPQGEYQLEFLEEHSGEEKLRFAREIQVGKDYLFMVGLGDTKMGYTVHTGHIEAVGSEDKFREGFWSEGRAAYYLKGKIKGKYLITSSLDTDREDVFAQVRSEDYYPVYGDRSEVVDGSEKSDGRLYVLVEWDRSSVLLGNFEAGLTGNTLTAFNGSFYGTKAELVSVSDTERGEAKQKVVVFSAQTRSMMARNEFVGTGGSLFYLKHDQIIPGSARVSLEVRDELTGLVLSSQRMRAGVDYDLDENLGRLSFYMPVGMSAGHQRVLGSGGIGGRPVVVVVEYGYESLGWLGSGSWGSRVEQAIGENMRVGAMYVKDGRISEDYELGGADIRWQGEDESELVLEYGQSVATQSGGYVSTDGGLTFSDVTQTGSTEGSAWSLRGQKRLTDTVEASGYYQRVDGGYSNSGLFSQQGQLLWGGGVTYELSEDTRLDLSYEGRELLPDAGDESRLRTGAVKTERQMVRLTREFERWRLTGMLDHRKSTGLIDGVSSSAGQVEGVSGGVEAEYQWDAKTWMKLREELSAEGLQNTIGVRREVKSGLLVSVEQSFGAWGRWTRLTAGGGESLDDERGEPGFSRGRNGESATGQGKFQVQAEQGRDDQGSQTRLSASGLVGEDTRVSTSYRQVDGEQGGDGGVAVQKGYQLDEVTVLETTGGLSAGRDGYERSVGLGARRKVDEDLTFEKRVDISSQGGRSELTNQYEWVYGRAGEANWRTGLVEKVSDGGGEKGRTHGLKLSRSGDNRWTGYANYEQGEVQDLSLVKYDRQAMGAGVGFVDLDPVSGQPRWQSWSKGELRLDEGSSDTRQYNILQSVEHRPNANVTLNAKVEMSRSDNLTVGSVLEEYQKYSTGMAYRPVNMERLNLLGQYTYLEGRKPAGQERLAGVEREKAHVLAIEGVYDLNARWQLTEKVAWRGGEEQVAGFEWTKSDTWLVAQGLRFRWDEDWSLYTEYRILRQRQAQDYRHGVHLELSRDFGEMVNVGLGYDLTDFTDDLTKLDYRAHGPFVRVTGVVVDRNEAELREIKARREAGATLREIRDLAREAYWTLYEQAMWLYDDAEEFYRDELLAMAKDRYEAVASMRKDYESARAYVREVEIKIKREADRFLKEERVRRHKDAKKLYRKGVRHYRSGEYEEARAAFEEIGRIVGDYKKTKVYLAKIEGIGY